MKRLRRYRGWKTYWDSTGRHFEVRTCNRPDHMWVVWKVCGDWHERYVHKREVSRMTRDAKRVI